jgi:hypothetical protein
MRRGLLSTLATFLWGVIMGAISVIAGAGGGREGRKEGGEGWLQKYM